MLLFVSVASWPRRVQYLAMPKNMAALHQSMFTGPSTPSHTLFNSSTELPENLNLDTMNDAYEAITPTAVSNDQYSLIALLQEQSDNLARDVNCELTRESTVSEFVTGFRADSSMEPEEVVETIAGSTKRKASELDSDSDSSVDSSKGKKRVSKPKMRQRYKKATIQNKTTLTEERHYTTEICTVAPSDQIAQYFAQDFSVYLDRQKSDCQMSANRFSDYISETGYYVFVVKKSEHKPFEVVFAKFVNNVTNEYTNNYYMVDNRVFVVSVNNVKFMVSYKLVREQGIDIPPHVNLCDDAQAERNPYDCYFEPVKNVFQTTLINHFHLDMYYSQTTFVTLMQSMGESKTGILLNKLYQMFQDRSLFTLPIMLSRKEPMIENTPLSRNYTSSYVAQIIKYSKNLRFPENNPDNSIISRLDEIVTQKSSLTYKYSSVANLLFNRYGHHNNNNADSLKKVKKEDGNRLLVEQYMSQNENDDTSHNFIVLQFGSVKNDERLTIAKKGTEFFWIAGEIKDINVDDLIKKYTRNVHHVFRIINVNRRESTTWHNNLLKMLQLLLQNLIRIDDVQQYSNKGDSKFVYKVL
ncbi:IE-1 [Choristoneura rosaceana nucleopolyhedrovirus]|uniref:IE-1 n=1 Tax=Choristoneura rosaceana nucleopolyhedrovirus TaxID=58094 RepID=S5N9Y9_9ABAC|nr:IE-1 [Choristoneura rosaceana nucleopolyhedrovirus]AGR57047.1 IE-1 [Choristoneura rosaceana nucleopolyhedrovirus]